MSLLDNIKQDQRAARILSRSEDNRVKANVLTTLLSEASKPGFNDGKRDSTDEEVVAVCKKFIKNLEEVQAVNHNEITAQEIVIVSEYLPSQLSEEELDSIVEQFVISQKAAGENPNIGGVMKFLKTNHSGLYDGKLASTLAKKYTIGA